MHTGRGVPEVNIHITEEGEESKPVHGAEKE